MVALLPSATCMSVGKTLGKHPGEHLCFKKEMLLNYFMKVSIFLTFPTCLGLVSRILRRSFTGALNSHLGPNKQVCKSLPNEFTREVGEGRSKSIVSVKQNFRSLKKKKESNLVIHFKWKGSIFVTRDESNCFFSGKWNVLKHTYTYQNKECS